MSATGEPKVWQVRWTVDGAGDAVMAAHLLAEEPVIPWAIRRERRASLRAAAGGLFIIPVFTALVWYKEPEFAVIGLIAGTVFFLLFVMWVSSNNRGWRVWRDGVRKIAERGPHARAESWAARVEPEGLRLSGPIVEQLSKWERFDRVFRVGGFLAVSEAFTGACISIPLESFATPDDADRFERDIDAGLESAGCSEAQRITRMLADSDLRCLRCKHPWRGLHAPVCPECGLRFSTMTIRVMSGIREHLKVIE